MSEKVIADTKLEPLRPQVNGVSEKSNANLAQNSDDKPNGLVTATAKDHKGIRWAPLKVPFKRRMQTFTVLWFELTAGICLSIFWFLCAVPIFWPVRAPMLVILIPYLVYLAMSPPPHDKPPRNWLTPIIRSKKFWSNYTAYFPMTLHRSAELPPDQNYLFGYHPHGIISHGAWGHFATKTTGWDELFPGISNTLLTLETNFRVPGYREYLIAMGLGSVSRKSCEGLLGGVPGEMSEAEVDAHIHAKRPRFFGRWRGKKPQASVNGTKENDKKPANKQGRGITIVVGGAQESLLAKPGSLRLVLQRRKGFCRVAIRTGAWLVPVLSFGENELYDQHVPEKSSLIYKIQILIKRTLGFTVPLFHARGIFNYDVGLLPYRRPVDTVVGRPIQVKQDPHPRDDYIDQIHDEYCKELERIWEENKDRFAPAREAELQFVQ